MSRVTANLKEAEGKALLQAILEPEFSASSYGFRPGRNAHQAVKAARQYVAAGRRIVVDMDLEKFFDRVNHDLLMGKLARKIDDGRSTYTPPAPYRTFRLFAQEASHLRRASPSELDEQAE